jgi:hypothetical protein
MSQAAPATQSESVVINVPIERPYLGNAEVCAKGKLKVKIRNTIKRAATKSNVLLEAASDKMTLTVRLRPAGQRLSKSKTIKCVSFVVQKLSCGISKKLYQQLPHVTARCGLKHCNRLPWPK